MDTTFFANTPYNLTIIADVSILYSKLTLLKVGLFFFFFLVVGKKIWVDDKLFYMRRNKKQKPD